MRADSAVEPTRSENITVTWRRSAVVLRARPGGCYSRNGDTGFALLDALEIGNGAKQFAAMAKRRHADLFEVRIGQVT